RRRHTRSKRDWSSDVCSSDLCFLVLFDPLHDLQYVNKLFLETHSHFELVTLRSFHCIILRLFVKSQFHHIILEHVLNYVWKKERSEERRVGKEGNARGAMWT